MRLDSDISGFSNPQHQSYCECCLKQSQKHMKQGLTSFLRVQGKCKLLTPAIEKMYTEAFGLTSFLKGTFAGWEDRGGEDVGGEVPVIESSSFVTIDLAGDGEVAGVT